MAVTGRLHSSCVQISMLHGSKTWPIRKENDVALRRSEMRMVRWMCGMKLQERILSKELRKWLELDDIISELQRTGCSGMGMCCEKKTMIGWTNVRSMMWRVPGQEVDQRKLGERLWEKTVRCVNWTRRTPRIVYGCHGCSRLGMIDDHDTCEWVNVSSGTGSPGLSWTKSREP